MTLYRKSSCFLFLVVCCLLSVTTNSAFGMERLGYVDRGIVKDSPKVILQEMSEKLSSLKKRNYLQTLPIKISASYLGNFLVYADQYSLGCFDIFQRTFIYSNGKSDIKGKEAFEFRLAGNLAAKLSSEYSSIRVDDSVFTRVPVEYSILDIEDLKNTAFDGPEGVKLIKQLLPLGIFSRDLNASKAMLILNIQIIPKNRFFFLSPLEFDKIVYIESVAAAARTLAIVNFWKDLDSVDNLKKYLNSKYNALDVSLDVQKVLAQYGSYSSTLTFDGAKDSVQEAFQELQQQINTRRYSGKEQNVELDNECFIEILQFITSGDGLFHLYNPMEFFIINLIYPRSSLNDSDRAYWRDAIIGSYKSKYIIENAVEVFSSDNPGTENTPSPVHLHYD